MQTYELMVVLQPNVEETNGKKLGDIVKALISDATVDVRDVASLGKKTLAYPIKKQTEGVYVLGTIEAQSLVVGNIEKRAKLHPDVLRYLLVVKRERKIATIK